MGGRGSGAPGRPKKDRTGEEHPSLSVLEPAPGREFGWRCRCKACGREFVLATSQVSIRIRKGHGCGCRRTVGLRNVRRTA